MKPDIISKLNLEMGRAIVSEVQVVYILVETRKLLEQQQQLLNFRTLKLCTDWAVHPKLSGTDAKGILSYFDDFEAEHRMSGVTVKEFNFAPLNDFLSHATFREQFIAALQPHGIDVSRIASDAFWRPFIQHYSSVIQDCPLVAVDDETRLVNEVTASAWPEDMAEGIFPGKCVVQWNWKPNDAAERKLICALI
jgi:hypothetical protein